MLKNSLVISRVILGIIGLIIFIDCVALMAVGKINFSTVVPLLLGIIFIVHGIFWHATRKFVTQNRWLNRIWHGLWVLFVIWLISFAVFVWSLQQQIRQSTQPLSEVAAIIVLGSGTVAGKPTPTLTNRLDAAVPIIEAQPQALVITAGGIGFGRSRSEADIMASYLNENHNVPLNHIYQEGKSTSTQENLANSQAILNTQGISLTAPIAIVTSDFHTIRAESIARHQGYQQPLMVASTTPLSIRYNARFREYFAFVSGWVLGEY